MKGSVFFGICFAALWIMAPAAAPAQGFDRQAAELASLRAGVEKLEAQLQSERAQASAEVRALTAQKGELALLVQKERIQVTALRRERARQLARLRAESERSAGLVPDLLASIKEVRVAIAESLPFKREQRLADLDKIKQGLQRRTLNPRPAFSRLWQVVEDELKLCQESGLYQQTITLDGRRMLADVARLGMVVLLFRTSDGTVGHARWNRDGSYGYVKAENEAVGQGIKEVFDSFKKQVRSGTFSVPFPPLPRAGGAS